MGQKKLERQINAALEAGRYQSAKGSTQQLIQLAKKNKSEHYYILAQAHFGLNEFDSCLQALQVYLQDKNHQDQALFLAARAFHYESNYLEAMHYYKLFLKTAGSQKVDRRRVKRLLLQAVFAERNAVNQSPAIASPYGSPINSPYEEGPIFQGSGQNYYFSSNRPDSSGQNGQIYQIEQKGRNWGELQALEARYNSLQHELLLGFSAGKDQIFFQRDSQGLVDNFQDTYGQSLAVPIALDSQYYSWTGDHYFFNDSLLFFAAGPHAQDLDIYYRKKNKAGEWSAPIALAFPLNTVAPERTPFLAADGKTLFFSRLSAQGIGDYDVYQSVYEVEKGQWSQPKLLPAPISSPGHDLFFRLSANGLGGQLLSQRAGGQGGLDVYQLYFRQERRAQLAVSASLDFLQAEQEQQPQVKNSEIPMLSALDSNSAETNITLLPLYYSAETGAWQDRRQLDRLLRLLEDYPSLNLLIEAHSDAQYEASRGLFLSVQQAQELAKELIDKGIATQRLYLRGCGMSYPQAQNFSFDGSPNLAGQQFNRRIELRLLQTQKTTLGVHYNWPELSTILLAPEAKNFRAESQGVRYRLAIQTSTQLFDDPILEQIQDVAAEKQPESPEITYYLGHARNFKAANALRETLEEGGFKAIRIQAYLDGWPLQKEQIPFLLNQYPDLKAYLTE